jgi:beta-N-acetylhexosaminidase
MTMRRLAIALAAVVIGSGLGGGVVAAQTAAAQTAMAQAARPAADSTVPSVVAQASALRTAASAISSALSRPRVVSTSVSTATPTVAQLIGQKLVVRMEGLTPSADLLGRIRRGEIGGVILFGSNITTATALIALTAKLHAAAAAGGQPRLLIAVDQEGGTVKRIPWAPPTLSAAQMGATGLASVARTQGAAAGTALHDLGIDVDFAPVADVPASTASFMYRASRTFSFSATRTTGLANAFAAGLESKGVLPTMKHFPGIGFATRNTDAYVVTINASRAALAPSLLPYRTAIANHIPLIMLSNATYPAYDAISAAGWSHRIAVTLLRGTLGFTGVTITDSLDGTAAARGLSTRSLAGRAARAGTDMILLTGSEASTRSVFTTLIKDEQSGVFSLATLRASYNRIVAMKARL